MLPASDLQYFLELAERVADEPVGALRQAGFERVRAATKWRLYGASRYAYACLATGRIDLSVDSGGGIVRWITAPLCPWSKAPAA
jgi:fructose-1,6-bisphosphatase/inositol monophosphatase family enzyme